MTYATLQHMLDAYGQRELLCIADLGNTGAIDEEHVNNALTTASSTIDFAVAQHNTLPLPALPDYTVVKLREWCCAIARYKLTGTSGVTVTDVVKARFEEAEAALEKIATGKMLLIPQPGGAGGAGGVAAQTITAGEAFINPGADRVFGPGAFSDYFG